MIDALRARFRLAMDRLRAESLTTRDWLLVAAAAVLALALSAALIWRQDILQSTLDPKQPFQTYRPPPAPDAARNIYAMASLSVRLRSRCCS